MEQTNPAIPEGPQADSTTVESEAGRDPRTPATAPLPGAQRPPKRRRRGRLVALAAIAVVAVAAAIWLALDAGGMRQAGQVRTAEDHYDAAVASLEDIEERLAALDLSPGAPVEARLASLAATATTEMNEAEEELREAERAISKTRSSESRRTYLSSTHEARLGIESLRGMLDYLRRTGGLLDRMNAAGKTSAQARKGVNEAIELANAEKWTASEKKARTAASAFEAAKRALNAAHAADPSAGLNKAAAEAAKEREEAELVARMAVLGKQGDVAGYNSLVARTQRLRAEMLKVGDPEIISDPSWVQTRLDAYGDVAAAHWREADKLRAEALRGYR